jgi:2-methylaconitate cis-trans-isomerase PrpF
MPEQGPAVVDTFIAIRHAAQDLLGVDQAKTTPWPISVTSAKPYELYGGGKVEAADYDFAVRFAGIQPMRDTLHEAHPGTASCCTAIAAVTEGTVVNELYAARRHDDDQVVLGHPSGTLAVGARVHYEGDRVVADRAVLGRTVRPIMRGEAFVRRAEIERLSRSIDAADRTRSAVPAPGQP